MNKTLNQINCLDELVRLSSAATATMTLIGDCALFYSPDLEEYVKATFTLPQSRDILRRHELPHPRECAVYPVRVPDWPENTWRIQMLGFDPKGTE